MTWIAAQLAQDVERIANAVERLERDLGNAPSFDDELRALATFASIALALLALFTNRRTDKLADERESGLRPWSSAEGKKRSAADVALAVATLAALATMLPAFVESVDFIDWFDRARSLESMFSLVYFGFAGVFAWQLANVWARISA